jgi:hypothetical protein
MKVENAKQIFDPVRNIDKDELFYAEFSRAVQKIRIT